LIAGPSGFEAELVADDQVGAEQVVDDAADGVVSEAAVEGLDEVGGREVADPEASGDGGMAEADEQLRLAGAGRTDQAEVLVGADPAVVRAQDQEGASPR
jgi:hypothetical protein